MSDIKSQQPIELKRSISLLQLAFYGIGTILGAGIYVLLGEVTKLSGMATPSAFLLSALIVSFSAYSYSRLSRMFPVSAGEAVYMQQAFNSRRLSQLTGLAIVLAGIVSSATLLNGFAAYIKIFLTIPDPLLITLMVLALFAITAWGVTQSVRVAVITTLIEILGLALVIYSSKGHWQNITWQQFLPTIDSESLHGVTAGAFLAFYAFIGFEDMVNMAEEVKKPRINMPLGILIALLVTLTLYELTAISALISVPLEQLANSSTPLALVIETNSRIPIEIISAISLVAIINGAMIQIIMASRVFYGMARKQMLPQIFGRLHKKRQTPIVATAIVSVLVWVFSLTMPLVSLAELTSGFILMVFLLVNLALLVIDFRNHKQRSIKLLIPIAGALSCGALLTFKLLN